MTVNDAGFWLLLVPSIATAVAFWIRIFSPGQSTASMSRLFVSLLKALGFTLLAFVVSVVLGAFTSGIYCEDCSTRSASFPQVILGVLYTTNALWLARIFIAERAANANQQTPASSKEPRSSFVRFLPMIFLLIWVVSGVLVERRYGEPTVWSYTVLSGLFGGIALICIVVGSRRMRNTT